MCCRLRGKRPASLHSFPEQFIRQMESGFNRQDYLPRMRRVFPLDPNTQVPRQFIDEDVSLIHQISFRSLSTTNFLAFINIVMRALRAKSIRCSSLRFSGASGRGVANATDSIIGSNVSIS